MASRDFAIAGNERHRVTLQTGYAQPWGGTSITVHLTIAASRRLRKALRAAERRADGYRAAKKAKP